MRRLTVPQQRALGWAQHERIWKTRSGFICVPKGVSRASVYAIEARGLAVWGSLDEHGHFVLTLTAAGREVAS